MKSFTRPKKISENFLKPIKKSDEDNPLQRSHKKNKNNSITSIRISQPRAGTRKIVTSISSRIVNKKKSNGLGLESINTIGFIPYLNNNQHSLGLRGRDLMNWDSTLNMNVFNSPGIYTSLPFLLENREEFVGASRNLLVEQMK